MLFHEAEVTKSLSNLYKQRYIVSNQNQCRVINSNQALEERMKELAEFYKVFGDATRVKLLYVLLESEMCVCDLAAVLQMTHSAISHQLRVLKQMKLVKNRRDGKTVYYSLADDHIQNIISQGMEHIME